MNFIKEKAGPFPVWVWGAILGGIATFIIWRSKSSASAPASTGTANVAGASGSTIAPGVLDSAYGYTPANTAGVTSSQAGAIVPDAQSNTNFAWSANVVTWLISQRYGGLAASQAVNAYLNGDALTSDQQGMINLALEKFGLPPEGVYAQSATTPAAPQIEPGDQAAYYAQKPGTQAIYAVYSNGVRKWLTLDDWKKLGQPQYYQPNANDPVWSLPVAGADAPLYEQTPTQ